MEAGERIMSIKEPSFHSSHGSSPTPSTPWESEVAEEEFIEVEEPPLFQVIMLNDDYTPMDFVVGILMEIFQKKEEEAFPIMLQIHTQGKAKVGEYPYDMAQTKVALALLAAEENQFPLVTLCEPAL